MMWLNRKSVEEITGLNSDLCEVILKLYGIRKGRTLLINNMVLRELIANGCIERIKTDKWETLLKQVERMEDRVYNLNLYVSYIEQNYPGVYADMIENLSGLPGYSRAEAQNG